MISRCWQALLRGALLALVCTGCSSPKVVKINGKLLKGGKPMVVSEDTYVTLSFIPQAKDDSPGTTPYSAKFEQKSGTYSVQLPPGNYRTMVVIAPPSKARADGKISGLVSIKSDKNYDLTKAQDLDIEVPAK